MPVSPWKEGEKVRTVGGGEVWWEEREGGKIVGAGIRSSGWIATDMDADSAGRY